MQHPATDTNTFNNSQDPHTPTDTFLATPSLTSPGTPHQADTYLQTPADRARPRSQAKIAMAGEEEEEGMQGVEEVGLGYGKVGNAMRVEKAKDSAMAAEIEYPKGFPDGERLRGMKRRFEEIERDAAGGAGTQSTSYITELLQMARSLLNPCLDDLPFLQGQLAAQRETIRTMQQQAKLSHQLITLERERAAAERQSWRTTTDALLRHQDDESSTSVKPKRLLDLDVGYHQELEAANKRLEMDNRLMAPRLVDTQRQIDNLVTELQYLRSHVVLSSHHFDDPAGALASRGVHPPSLLQDPPTASAAAGGPIAHFEDRSRAPEGPRRSKSPSKAMRGTTMGDARSEHLLLAARKVRAMRQADDRVGRITIEELKRGGVVGPDGGLGYSEGYGGIFLAEEDADEVDDSDLDEEKPFIAERRVSSSATGTRTLSKGKQAATPVAAKGKKGGKRLPTTPGNQKSTRQPLTTPGGSNFTDLLRAAEMATRPTTPTPEAPRRHREESPSDAISPTKKVRRMWVHSTSDIVSQQGFPSAPATGGKGAEDADNEESALDLLLQASQIGPSGRGKSPAKSTVEKASVPAGEPLRQGLAPPLELRQMSSTPIADHLIDPALADPPAPAPVSAVPRQPATTSATPSASASTPFVPATGTGSTPALGSIATPRQRPRNVSNASASLAAITTPARNWSMYQDSPFGGGDTPSGFSPYPHIKRDATADMMGDVNAFNSPTGGTVPGLGKYVHLTSSMPARRIRSPYLKWTVEEDELLARAVALHGEKWDLVSKGVPTRSYHQVRQRWLRKTGAFDKKPGAAIEAVTTEDGEARERERPASPTPAGAQGKEGGKKRKMSLLG